MNCLVVEVVVVRGLLKKFHPHAKKKEEDLLRCVRAKWNRNMTSALIVTWIESPSMERLLFYIFFNLSLSLSYSSYSQTERKREKEIWRWKEAATVTGEERERNAINERESETQRKLADSYFVSNSLSAPFITPL